MAVAFDAVTTANLSFTSNPTTSHTPVGTPRGVLALIAQNMGGNSTPVDEVTGVTYGGTALTEQTGSPFAQDAGTENAMLYAYWLGSGVPATSPATVAVGTTGDTASKRICVVTVTAAADTQLEDLQFAKGLAADPPFSLTITHDSVVISGLHSGQNAVGGITQPAGYTNFVEFDYGTQTASFDRRDSNTSTSESTNYTASSEEYGTVAAAISEVAGGAASRTAADTAAATDAATRLVTLARTAADTASATDAAPRIATFARSAADTTSATDATARTWVAARTASDTAAATDTATRAAPHSRVAADAATASDTAAGSTAGNLQRTAADTASTADAAGRAATIPTRTAADTTAAADVVTRAAPRTRTAADTASAADAATGIASHSFTRAAVDTATITDTAAGTVASFTVGQLTATATATTMTATIAPTATLTASASRGGPS